MVVNFDAIGEKVMSPSKLAHVVLRTGRLAEMAKFYTQFLGAKIIYENKFICFLSYDSEHHRIALIEVPDTVPKVSSSCGLEHIAFSYDTLADLALAYRQRKAREILPVWCVNHGPTTSIYYADPDGNQLETQVDNFEDAEDATRFMSSKLFEMNPIGSDFDPEVLIQRLEAGESEESIKSRKEIGERGLNGIPLI